MTHPSSSRSSYGSRMRRMITITALVAVIVSSIGSYLILRSASPVTTSPAATSAPLHRKTAAPSLNPTQLQSHFWAGVRAGRYASVQVQAQAHRVPAGGTVSTGSVYAVSATGSDTNACTTASPCATLAHALAVAQPGDTVVIESGLYNSASNAFQTVTAHGSASQPIAIVAQPAVTLTYPAAASASQQTTPLLSIVNSSYVTISGIHIVGMAGRSDAIAGTAPTNGAVVITSTGVSAGVVVSDVLVSQVPGTCLNATNQPVSIEASMFQSCTGTSSDVAVRIAGSGVTFQNNAILGASGIGLVASGTSAQASAAGDLIQGNYVSGVQGAEAMLIAGDGSTIRQNIMSHNPGLALLTQGNGEFIALNMFDNDVYSSAVQVDGGTGTSVVNNTFLNDVIAVGLTHPTVGTVVENNVFGFNLYSPEILAGPNASNTLGDYNYFGNTATATGTDSRGNQLVGAHTIFGAVALDVVHLRDNDTQFFASGTPVGLPYSGSAPDLGAFCFLSCVPGQGATYAVSPSGSDSNPCTTWWPCTTLDHASSFAGAGDTVIVEPGMYTTMQSINAGGSANAPVTISAQPGVTLTFPASTQTAAEQARGQLRVTNGFSHLIVNGFTVIGMKGRPDFVADPWGTGINGTPAVEFGYVTTDITVTGMTIENADATCLNIQDNARVYSSTLLNCGKIGDGQTHGIYASGINEVIVGNYLAGAPGYLIHCHNGQCYVAHNIVTNGQNGIVADVPGSTIDSNLIYNNTDMGISTNQGVNIINNVSVNNGGTGLQVGPGSLGLVTVLNNTIVQNGSPTRIMPNAVPLFIENNIFDSLQFTAAAPAGSIVDYNLYAPGQVPFSGDGAHSIYANPLFVTTTAVLPPDLHLTIDPQQSAGSYPDLHLTALSPAIAAGRVVGTPTGGILGYGGTHPDLGALCFHCGSAIALPVHPTGPSTFVVAPGQPVGVNACSESSPCGSLLEASRLAQAGDTIVMQTGVYTVPQIIETQGTASSPITVEAAAGASVTLSRPNAASDGLPAATNLAFQSTPVLTILNSQHTIVSGMTVSGMKGRADSLVAAPVPFAGDIAVLSPNGTGTSNTIATMTVAHSLAACLMSDGQPVSFVGNTVSDCANAGISSSANDSVVTQNTVSGIGTNGIDLTQGSSGPGAGDVIMSNTVTSSPGSGIVLGTFDNANNAAVTGNLLAHNGLGGVTLWGSNAHISHNIFLQNSSADSQRGNLVVSGTGNQVYNNTFYQSQGGSEISLSYNSLANNTLIVNNIFDGRDPTWDLPVNLRGSTNTTASYNLLYNVPTPTSGADSNGNILLGTHTIVGQSPLLLSPGTTPVSFANYSLANTSLALGAGTLSGLPSDAAIDLGAVCSACSTPVSNLPVPPTATSTPVQPTATSTPVPPTATSTPIPPTATNIPVAPTATSTSVPPTVVNTPLPSSTSVPAAASVELFPARVTVGQSVSVVAAGFAPAEPMTFVWDSVSGTPIATANADGTGHASVTLTMPTITGGHHTLYAIGQSSQRQASTDGIVNARVRITGQQVPASNPVPGIAAGLVSLASSQQTAASTSMSHTITLQGDGFSALEAIVAYLNAPNGQPIGQTTTSTFGAFDATSPLTVQLPSLPAGTYRLFVVGQSSQTQTSILIHVYYWT